MKAKILSFFIFSALFAKAQYYDWDKTEKLSDSVFTNAKKFYSNYYKDNIYVGDAAGAKANSASTYFYTDYVSGEFYPSFMGYESYVRDILRKVIPDEKLVNNIKIYFNRDYNFNAYRVALGVLRINTGLFCYVNTEAELAAILAHEASHFYNKDGLDKRGHIFRSQFGLPLDFSHLKTQESAADFLAIKYLKESPYSLKGMAETFKTFKRFEIKRRLVNKDAFIMRITHPDPGERLKQVKLMAKDSVHYNKKNFVVDSVKFVQLKTAARVESFKQMRSYGDYRDLIELSFTHYLYHPDDQQNLSVLLESLKWYLIKFPKAGPEQFIISFYKGSGAEESENYKFVDSDSTSILKYLNKGLLHLQSTNLAKLPKNDLLDTVHVKFRSNTQALNYFSQKAKELNCEPCRLTELHADDGKLAYKAGYPFKDAVYDYSSYLEDKNAGTTYSENIFVVDIPSLYIWEYVRDHPLDSLKQWMYTMAAEFKQQSGLSNIHFVLDMSLKDQNAIRELNRLADGDATPGYYYNCILGGATNFGSGGRLATKPVMKNIQTFDLGSTYPEGYSFFAEHKAKNLYIVQMDYVKIDPRDYPAMTGPIKTCRAWRFKKVAGAGSDKQVYEHNVAQTIKTPAEAVKECASAFKFFVSGNK